MSYFIVTLVTAAVRGCLGVCRIFSDKATIVRDISLDSCPFAQFFTAP